MVGWGHASENPKLGDMLKEKAALLGKEVTFIGPTSPVMRVLGDKIGSNLVAQGAGVSTMPWNGDGLTADLDEMGNIPFEQFDAACIHTEEEAVDAANKCRCWCTCRVGQAVLGWDGKHSSVQITAGKAPPAGDWHAQQCPPPLSPRIGYPVMLKASEGGGGKGIRKALNEEELRASPLPSHPSLRPQAAVGPPPLLPLSPHASTIHLISHSPTRLLGSVLHRCTHLPQVPRTHKCWARSPVPRSSWCSCARAPGTWRCRWWATRTATRSRLVAAIARRSAASKRFSRR